MSIYEVDELKLSGGKLGCFIKGFARGIDFSSRNNALAEKLLLSHYINSNADYFFWDGDDYSADSFTHLIRKMMTTDQFKSASFMACKKRKEIPAFRASWETIARETKTDIGVLIMDDALSWDALGVKFYISVMHQLPRSEIYCIGGGETLSKEFKTIKLFLKESKGTEKLKKKSGKHTNWFIFRFERANKEGGLDQVFDVYGHTNRFVLDLMV